MINEIMVNEITFKTKEIQIANRNMYVYIYIPLVLADDYLGDLDGFVSYTLTFLNHSTHELYAIDILQDMPEYLTLNQLRDLCKKFEDYVVYSVVGTDIFIDEWEANTLSNSYDILPPISGLNSGLKDILNTFYEGYIKYKEYNLYKEELKNIKVSGFTPKISKQLKIQLLIEKNYTCENCHKKFDKEKLQIHHKKSRSKFGSNLKDNLEVVCEDCHKLLDTKDNHNDIVPKLKSNPNIKHMLSNLEIKQLLPNLEFLTVPKDFLVSQKGLKTLVNSYFSLAAELS